MSIVLGLDVGTSGTKAIAMDETGRLMASALVEYPLHSPKPGWAEQDPADWKKAAFEALAQLAAKIHPAEVKGLGLTGQRLHGGHVDQFIEHEAQVVEGRGEGGAHGGCSGGKWVV